MLQKNTDLLALKKLLGDSVMPISSGFHKEPTAKEVRAVIDYLKLPIKEICNITGASYREDKSDSGTVRAWKNGTSKIPYSTWVILLLKLDVICIEDFIKTTLTID